jgi:hypothetical protein
MAKYVVYQIKKSNRELASNAQFYTESDAFTQATARLAFKEGQYSHNADVEAETPRGVADLIKNERTSTKIVSTGPLRTIGVGDLIHNASTNQWFIVSPVGFDQIKIIARR